MSSENNPTRDRILKATWALLETGGASSVRMSDIAKKAGISRQALYLHFPNRAELLVATVRYLDEVYDIQSRLAAGRDAEHGAERLEAWVDVWGNYIPSIFGIAKALMAMEDSDPEARAAWADRKAAIREGCAAAIEALAADGILNPLYSTSEATDLLWVMVSVASWEHLCRESGWSQNRFTETMKQATANALIARPGQVS